MIRIKPGVSLDNTHEKMWFAVAIAAQLWRQFGSPDLWITGGNELGHAGGPRGFHHLPNGTCQAIDLRTWSIPKPEDRQEACRLLRNILGSYYDVLFEAEQRNAAGVITRGEHVHVQYDPERPGTVI